MPRMTAPDTIPVPALHRALDDDADLRRQMESSERFLTNREHLRHARPRRAVVVPVEVFEDAEVLLVG